MVYYSNQEILPSILTPIQEQVLIGSMLGDGHLSLDQGSRYPRLKIDRQEKDLPYLKWQFDIFEDLCKSGIKEIERYDHRYDKSYKQVSFRTRSVPAFSDYYHQWYFNKLKKVPQDIQFTPIILATWFSDDGSIINHGNNILTLKIATDGFGYHGTKILSQKLEQYFRGYNFAIYQKKKGKDLWYIKTSTKAAQVFVKSINPIIKYNGMFRKYQQWENVNLDHCPIIGRPTKLQIR